MKVYVNADGGSRGNPGPAGIGVVVWDEDRVELECHKEYLGTKTNNEAEYHALLKALELARKHSDEAEIIMDSEVVVKQMNGEYSVNAPNLGPLHEEAKKVASEFKLVTFSNVPRENRFQAEADRLVNEALDDAVR